MKGYSRSSNRLVMRCLQLVCLATALGLNVAEVDLHFCCERISSDPICNDTCIETLAQISPSAPTLSSLQFQALSSACSPTFTTFWSCVNDNISSTTPTIPPTGAQPQYSVCCAEGGSAECRQACEQSFASNGDVLTSVQNLIATRECQVPGPVFTCVLELTPTEPPSVDPTRIPDQPRYADWARVQCCYKAVAEECRTSCLDLYSGLTLGDSWSRFQLDCIHRPSESVLQTCLLDVGSPCKLGCSNLQFCSFLNNRPTMSFRQCTNSADRMAKTSYQSWVQNKVIQHPLIDIFADNIDTCLSEMWKAVACITHIQPCHATTHATQICREDCLRLLRTCSGDSDRTPEGVCDIIAPVSSQEHCISLQDLLEPSVFTSNDVERVTNPCSPNPCAEGYFCAINHRCQSGTQTCTPFTCQPGCVVGDRPSFVVSEGGSVRVSLVVNSDRSCYGYFNCTQGSTDTGSAQVTPLGGSRSTGGFTPVHLHCEEERTCFVNGTMYNHQTIFRDGCNFCTCFHGRVTCTNRNSCYSDIDEPMGSSCDCTLTRSPVCTIDGRTFPNSCMARCLGYREDQFNNGDCNSVNPCGGPSSSVCGSGYKCLPNRHVCITADANMTGDCSQHTCASTERCTSQEPVCDSDNVQHSSLCSFLTTQGEIDYFGFCQDDCSQDNLERVCGVNGETYSNRCHAENAYIAVDYIGPCTSIPSSNTEQDDIIGSCHDVICPQLPPDCVGVMSHDSCCPQCGSHLTLLLDKEMLQRNLRALGRASLSSADMFRKLRYQISSLECDLFGHVSHDDSVSVWVLPIEREPDSLIIKACNAEAVKLATFINNQTPMLASDPILSHLVAAEVVNTDILSSNRATPPSNKPSTPPGHINGADHVIPSIVLMTLLLLLVF